MARNSESNDPILRAGSSYPSGQLQRALEAAVRHEDPELRRRAEQRAIAWEEVIAGIQSGTLQVGSRTPVENTPAWITLEVAHGGFATGRYIAEGPIQPWEQALLSALPSDFNAEATNRYRLNSWYLTDAGLEQLQTRITDRTYAIDVPEDGALLVVAWLAKNGFEAAALDLVAELYPLLDRLRFYPRPTDRPIVGGALVNLRTSGEVAAQLKQIEVPEQLTTMRSAVTVWNPLVDQLIEIWLGTSVDGWPCQQWPNSWAADRKDWLDRFQTAAHAHPRSRHLHKRSNFMVMRDALERCPNDSSSLSARDVGRLRKAIDQHIERWGAAGSEPHVELRTQQMTWASLATHREIAQAVADRLSEYPSSSGVADISAVVDSVPLRGEAVAVPPSLIRKTQRALEAPVEDLVECGVIGSAEVLAHVLPQISSQVAAAGVDNADLRPLYSQIYRAFRGRRSLLLLNLEHQVQIEELPWVSALDSFRSESQSAQLNAAQTLAQTTMLAITSFPQTILPNPLVKELSALAEHGELEIPFVEEIAADIFMGTFTRKWREAARISAVMLEGSLYARYYDLPAPSTWAPPSSSGRLLDKAATRWGKQTADDFATLCQERSKEANIGDGSHVARNGAVIEQSQVLTTHNLAPLVNACELRSQLSASAPHLASDIFTWIVRQQTMPRADWRSRLHMLKNTAYAWRQALFLLSLVDDESQQQTINELRALWASAPPEWKGRFEPALIGLESVAAGGRFDDAGHLDQGRRFLGWSVGPHWLSPPQLETRQRR